MRDRRRVEERRDGIDADHEDAAERGERQQARANQRASGDGQWRQNPRVAPVWIDTVPDDERHQADRRHGERDEEEPEQQERMRDGFRRRIGPESCRS